MVTDGRAGVPPGVRRLVESAVGPKRVDDVLGDLEELAGERRGLARRLFFWREAWALRVRTVAGRPRPNLGGSQAYRSGWMADARFAVRSFRRTPVVTLAILATLALGVGASTAIFSVVDAVLLRPLPFPEPDRLVVVYETEPATGRLQPFSPPDLDDFRAAVTSLRPMAGWVYERYAMTGVGDPEQVLAVRTTEGFWEVLGGAARLGRTYQAEVANDARTAVLSHGFWTARFASDPGVMGRTILLDHTPYEIVGVMPPSFRFPDRDDVALWIPLVRYDWEQIRHTRNTSVLARLVPDVTPQAAQEELSAVASRLSAEYPRTNQGWSATLEPAGVLSGDGSILVVLLAAVGLVLLTGCASVANLLLARASDRAQELAVRRSLGASATRVARQLLVESGVLAAVGTVLGVGVAWGGVRLFLALEPGTLPSWNPVGVNGRVLGFAAALALLVTVAAGFLPALRAGRAHAPGPLPTSAARAGTDRRGTRLRAALSALEVGLAVVLLTGAGLLVSSMVRLSRVDPGFRPSGLVTATVELPETRYEYGTGVMEAAFEGVLAQVRALPGVSAAGLVTTLPMSPVGTDYDVEFFLVEDPDRTPAEAPPQADFRVASGGYFDAMGIPVVQGRGIRDSDRTDAAPVAVINQTLARRFFPGEDPVGRHVQVYSPQGPGFRIVGVVGDVRHRGLDDVTRPELYLPYQQMTHAEMTLAVRSDLDTPTLVRGLREAVSRVDPELPLVAVRDAPALVRDSVADRRFNTALLLSFAALALSLAVVGVYGTLSYSVSRRRREIGVRMAVGASRAQVRRLVVTQGARLVAAGLTLGLLGAAVLTRALRAQLYGIELLDPTTYLSVVAVVVAVALTACWIPAWRASKVEPTRALREG